MQELPLARIKKIMKLDEDVKVRGIDTSLYDNIYYELGVQKCVTRAAHSRSTILFRKVEKLNAL